MLYDNEILSQEVWVSGSRYGGIASSIICFIILYIFCRFHNTGILQNIVSQ